MQIDSKLPKLEAKIGCVVEDIRPRGLIILCAAGKRGDSGEVARENAHSYRPVTFRR